MELRQVHGTTFVLGGTQIVEFGLISMATQTVGSFMLAATAILIIPTAYAIGISSSTEAGVLALSRGTAIILLIIYSLLLLYRFKTHSHVFEHLYEDYEGDSEGVVIAS